MTSPASSTSLAGALQALVTAFGNLVAALTVEGIVESPELASIGTEIGELPGNILDCAALAAELAGA